MKHLIFVIVVLLTPSIGFSEWENVGYSDEGDWYVDYSRIEVRNGYVYSWYLLNRYEPGSKNSLSTVFYDKFDCVNNRNQGLEVSAYKSHFGEQFIDSYEPAFLTWNYAEPSTVNEGIHKLICQQAGQ